MEGTVEGNDPIALRGTGMAVVLPRHLDGGFDRLGSGIGKKHLVRETVVGQPTGEAFLAGDPVEIGCVPELFRLRLERAHQMWMGMPEQVDSDPAAEIEIALVFAVEEPYALTANEFQRRACIGGQDRRDHVKPRGRVQNETPAVSAAGAAGGIVRQRVCLVNMRRSCRLRRGALLEFAVDLEKPPGPGPTGSLAGDGKPARCPTQCRTGRACRRGNRPWIQSVRFNLSACNRSGKAARSGGRPADWRSG